MLPGDSSGFRSALEERVRVHSAALESVQAIMKMRRRSFGISRVAHVSDHGSFRDRIAGPNAGEPVEMRVIMPIPSGTKHANDPAAQRVLADRHHDSSRRARNLGTAASEDVDSSVRPAARPRRAQLSTSSCGFTPRTGIGIRRGASVINSRSARTGCRNSAPALARIRATAPPTKTTVKAMATRRLRRNIRRASVQEDRFRSCPMDARRTDDH
jgi:hypothetical protein